jgi:(p)ppGpp synthase/HD superfamily hydrolase
MTGEWSRGPVALPRFAESSRLVAEAYVFAYEVHEGPRRRGETRIGHPAAVAELLHDAGYDDEVLAAALLHDVIEDTDADAVELRDRFGERVAVLVAELTENPAIGDYAMRKAALRAQATGDGEQAAAIFAADKLASVQKLLVEGTTPDDAKLEHYRRTAEHLRRRYPDIVFVAALENGVRELGARAGVA